jgi:putative ABC transport system permease protein
VVFQFAVSTVLIVCTLVVFKQLSLFRNKNLGLDKENVLVIANSNRLGNDQLIFTQSVRQLKGITEASQSTGSPSEFNFADIYQTVDKDSNNTTPTEVNLSSYLTDEQFIPTLGISMAMGRNFSKDFFDSASVILNETAVRQLGWTNPIGKRLKYPGSNVTDQTFEVIGVTKDFNIGSLQTAMTPFALFHNRSQAYSLGREYILVKVAPGELDKTIARLESEWRKFVPAEPFDYHFLDSAYDALYRSEQRMGNLFSIFTALSIFVACLGLFGLSAYTAERRMKEIGVRKVLGASVHGLVALLSKDFLKLVFIATLIAFPVAYYFMDKWLENFAYRIDISWWIFGLAALLAAFIALFTMSFQAIRAALANPVNSLKTE